MNPNEAFTDLNIDAVTGASLMGLLGLNIYELSDPQRFQKFRSIIDFFKQFPEDTQQFLITRATVGKNVDKLNHVYEYSTILDKKLSLEKQFQDLSKEQSTLNIQDPIILEANARRSLDLSNSINQIKNQIEVYEK